MGFILWGFFLTMLLCGIEAACWLYGTAILIGFAYGTYKHFKERE